MIGLAVLFLVIALLAKLFGLKKVSSGAAHVAKILFYVFLILFLITLIAGLL